jgi:starch-binding outer membrane protein, SusD/RagB family
MKRIFKIKSVLVAIVLSLSFAGCSDLLNVSSNSLLSDDVIFSNVDSTNYAIGAIYDIFGQNNSYRNRLWLQMGTNTDIEYRSLWSSGVTKTSTKTDDMISLYAASTTMGDGYNNTDAANPWSRIYQGIERANLAIAGIRKYGNPEAGNDMGHLLGEALSIRAFFYYDLIKWWGDVPARFEPVSEATIYLAKTDRDTIYNQIIADLQEAIPMLYSANATYTTSTLRINKDAARGLLARICLSAAGYSMRPISGSTTESEIKITASDERRTELYTIAKAACKDIIDDGNYSLASTFKQIFYDQCQNVLTQGREAIWQLPYVYGTRGRMVYNLGLPRDADGQNNTVSIGGQFRIMPNFYYDYNVSDTRRDITVVPYKVSKNSSGVMEQSLSGGVLGFNLGKWRAEWMETPISGTDDGVSPIVLRYADVLLMYAEADLYLSGSDEITSGDAYTYFNMVRRRAFGVDVNSTSAYDKAVTLINIKQERAFEFAGENIRKYDLMRWGELKSAIDDAKLRLAALRDGTTVTLSDGTIADYTEVPSKVYYKWTVDATYNTNNNLTSGEKVLTVYGLQRGESADKTSIDPNGGWIEKDWTQAIFSDVTGTPYYLDNQFINGLYTNSPDKRQLLPIMSQIISNSNGMLFNDYGYDE